MKDLFGRADEGDDRAQETGHETYRDVTTHFRDLTRSAVLVDAPPSFRGKTVWLPRSLIHGADDLKLGNLAEGAEITFRLMDWKAEEVGFA